MKRMYPASLLVIALSLSACATRPPDLAASPTPTAAQPQPSAAPFAADQTRMIPVQGGQVFVRINGRLDADRPPVVFIHGGPGGTHHGFVQALPLADERAVILYDQLDTGASDRPGDRANWTVARFVSELESIRSALGIERWHVVGHSWGGTLALEYAAAHPEPLASVTLASPLISTRSWIADTDHWRTLLPANVQRDLRACESDKPPAQETCEAAEGAFYQRHLARTRPGAEMMAYYMSLRDDPKARGNKAMYEAMWGPSEFTANGTLKHYDGEPLLAKLPGARTLFLAGQYDEARPETITAFARRVSGAELSVIPGAAHSVLGDRPEEVIATLRTFLRRHDAPVDASH